MASKLDPVGVFSILQSNLKFYHIYTVTIVIHKSRNLIGTLGIAKFGHKYCQVFQSNIESLLIEAPSSSQRAQGDKRLIVVSL